MKVAVFGNQIASDFIPVLEKFFCFFRDHRIPVQFYKPFYSFLTDELKYSPFCSGFFQSYEDFDSGTDLVFSIGGDGTFLHAVQVIQNFDVPMVGINSGRLGFLADISQEHVLEALNDIVSHKYKIVERSMLQVDYEKESPFAFSFALNEMTVLKSANSSMIRIKALVNGELLNNYWADGLIIATPTGSTAYSLSVGGPVLTPGSENFVVTPIAPHNLTIRPIIVPDHSIIRLEISGKGTHFLTSLDSRSENIAFGHSLTIRKAPFALKTILPEGYSFFNTLRTKLMWGIDKRN
jgi:NAD+ kinase